MFSMSQFLYVRSPTSHGCILFSTSFKVEIKASFGCVPFQRLWESLSFQAYSYYWPNPLAYSCSTVVPISLLIIRTLRGFWHFLPFYPFSKPAMENLFPIKSFWHFEFLLPGRAQSPWRTHLVCHTPRIICLNLSTALGPEL